MTVIAEASGSVAKSWRYHVFALGLIVVLMALEFHDALHAALQVWVVSPTYSHCFLIVPIAAWLIWEKRAALRAIQPRVAPQFLWFIPFLIVIWWLGELSTINEVRQYAVIALVQVMTVALLGTQVLRIIWFPILFLLFLVPTGEYLISPMQHFATRFVDVSLNLLNIPHYTEGTTLELTNGRFEIAEACAGLRFLVATVTLGVLFCYLMYRKIYKILLFLVASVAVPLIGNGLRCVGIILLTHFTNNKYGAGADHIVYGWGFNVAILLLLAAVGAAFRDDLRDIVFTPPKNYSGDGLQALTIVMLVGAVLISIGPAFSRWRDTRLARADLVAMTDYLRAGGWSDRSSNNWLPYFPGADARLIASLSPADSAPIDFFVGYYARPRTGHSLTSHLNQPWGEAWNVSTNNVITAPLGQRPVKFQEAQINSGFERRLVWSSYWVDATFTPSVLDVKLHQAKAVLEGHEGQAVVALSTPIDGPLEEARARLGRALARLGGLPATLAKADNPPPLDGAR